MAAGRQASHFSLRTVDPKLVAGSRGAKPDPLYSNIIEEFLGSGVESQAVENTGKKPLALRQGLNMALKRMALTDKVLVSLIKESPSDTEATLVILSLRK